MPKPKKYLTKKIIFLVGLMLLTAVLTWFLTWKFTDNTNETEVVSEDDESYEFVEEEVPSDDDDDEVEE